MGSLVDQFDTGPIGLGLFQEGAMFGPADNSSQEAQAAFLQRMMGREGDLYPELKKQLADSGLLSDQALEAIRSGTGPQYESTMKSLSTVASMAPQAFKAATAESNKLYGGVQSGINAAGDNAASFNLPPEALDALNKIKQERIASIGNDVNNLVGSKISDYARRGVTSSSTAEGMGAEVGKAIAPTINQAETEYQQARLAMPGQLYNLAKDRGLTTYGLGAQNDAANTQAYKDYASSLTDTSMKQYGLAAGQSQLTADALGRRRAEMVDPYLEMWKTAGGIGAQNPAAKTSNTAGASAAGSIIGAVLA